MTESFFQWLTQCFGSVELTHIPLAGDASFRRYFRVYAKEKTKEINCIAMDASMEKDKCAQFIAIANALRQQGVVTPEILASDLSQGYLLLTDFGDDLLLKKLNINNVELLYTQALNTLSVLSRCQSVSGYAVPGFTKTFMREEMNWFQEWFLEKHLNLFVTDQENKMLARSFDLLAEAAASQPQIFMHRDYHSANLMVLPENKIGVLDFQDAFIGPVTYDLVSLLRDCYIDWPNDLIVKLALHYQRILGINASESEFLRWFDWMGIQRHLKALLTFSRKYRRDQNANYLQYIPRTLNYVLQSTEKYPEYQELNHFLRENVLERIVCVP